MKLGYQLHSYGKSFRQAADEVVAFENVGLDVAWTSESYSLDGITAIGYLAACTRRVQLGTSILALMRVPKDQISRYGCAEIAESRGKLHRVSGLVEKPKPEEAKSDLAVMGRYVLTPAIFPALRETRPGALGEIQLTDAIGLMLGEGDVWGVEFEGELLDVGTPAGWLATNMRLAREHPEFRNAVAGIDATGVA